MYSSSRDILYTPPPGPEDGAGRGDSDANEDGEPTPGESVGAETVEESTVPPADD